MFQISSREPIEGKLIGNHVIVDDLTLYNFDYYGKGEMSRSTPCFSNWFDANTASTNINHHLPANADDANNNPEMTPIILPPKDMEKLILSLQEAFYLYYALGCLRIRVGQNFTSIQDCFKLFCEIEGTDFFISRYAIYHYFRSRGWITRSGAKYGCDYVLYRKGPHLEHAKYGVNIISSKKLAVMTWKELQHHCRTSLNVKKDLLICQYQMLKENIDFSNNVTDILKNCITLATMKVARFVPERDREADND